jgi:Mn-containing catalase
MKMFMHNKRLQYTVRVGETNPALASLLLEQFGGPDGELAAAMRYFTQGLGEDDPGRKDLLLDIATEELSHLEVIGSIVAMLNKGIKAQLSEAALAEADLYRSLMPVATATPRRCCSVAVLRSPIRPACRGRRLTSIRAASRPVTCGPTLPPRAAPRSSTSG